MTYKPSFKCEYCGEYKSAVVNYHTGVFVPCQCPEARKHRDQQHYIEMERRKQQKRQG